MQDLRLIGVHEDGQHLLLADSEGGRYRLPLDEALRAAARRDRPRLGQLQIEIEGGLRPRDVQALLRRGFSTEEVADRAGWSVEKVQRFEGPILAEREYVARQARATVLDSRGVDAREPVTLGDRVVARLKEREVDLDGVVWDSARVDDGSWRVHLHFVAGGRERTATWRFDPTFGAISPVNDESRWLGEDDQGVALPAPHVATTTNRLETVFDVDAPAGRGGHRASERQAAELASSMRSGRHAGGRSRRRQASPSHTPVADTPREDALPLEHLPGNLADAGEPPAARGYHDIAAHLDERADEADATELIEPVSGLPAPSVDPAAATRAPTGISRALRAVPTVVDPIDKADDHDMDVHGIEVHDDEHDDDGRVDDGRVDDGDLGDVGDVGEVDETGDMSAHEPQSVIEPAGARPDPAASEVDEPAGAQEADLGDTLIEPLPGRPSAPPSESDAAAEGGIPDDDVSTDDASAGAPDQATASGASAEERPAQRRRNRRGRKSVPSWDDIMFGGRSGGGDEP